MNQWSDLLEKLQEELDKICAKVDSKIFLSFLWHLEIP